MSTIHRKPQKCKVNSFCNKCDKAQNICPCIGELHTWGTISWSWYPCISWIFGRLFCMHTLCTAFSLQNYMESVFPWDVLPLWECVPHPFEIGMVQLVVVWGEAWILDWGWVLKEMWLCLPCKSREHWWLHDRAYTRRHVATISCDFALQSSNTLLGQPSRHHPWKGCNRGWFQEMLIEALPLCLLTWVVASKRNVDNAYASLLSLHLTTVVLL